jgi:hypothetical protein
MNYRFDSRSREEFERDIKERTLEERRLFLLWLDLLERENGTKPSYTDTGCGKDGDFLEDTNVTTEPDFNVEGYGKIEVKFAKPLIDKFFHLKVSHVKACKECGASILMINGAREEQPVYTMIRPEFLEKIMDTCPIVPFQGMGHKPCYKIHVNNFVWRPLQ